MELIGWTVIVPLSLAALASGLIQSLGIEWGLFRHYWIAVKFGMASVGSVILLTHDVRLRPGDLALHRRHR